LTCAGDARFLVFTPDGRRLITGGQSDARRGTWTGEDERIKGGAARQDPWQYLIGTVVRVFGTHNTGRWARTP
jgi:hypothetical protein